MFKCDELEVGRFQPLEHDVERAIGNTFHPLDSRQQVEEQTTTKPFIST